MRCSIYVLLTSWLVGCGGSPSSDPDSGPRPDAPGSHGDGGSDLDAPGPDPVAPCDDSGAPGSVVVRGAPLQHGILVHDRSGAVLERTMLDASGETTLTVPPCSAITFLKGRSTFFTVLHVMPGDVVTLRYPFTEPGVRWPVEVSFPAFTGASLYAVRPASHTSGECSAFGGSTTPITVEVHAGCIDADATVDLVVEASDANGVIAYATIVDAPLAASGTTQLAITAWQTETRSASVLFQNTPDGWSERIAVFAMLDGKPVRTQLGGAVPAFGTHVLASAAFTHPAGHESGIDGLQRVVPAAALGSLVLDGATDFAPHVADSARDDADAARPVITWTTTVPVTEQNTHAIAITADWEGFQWFVIAPPTQPGFVRFPELPADLRPTTPPQTGRGALAVMTARLSAFTGFADARANPLALWFAIAYGDPTDTFEHSFSALGDYDQPNID